MFEFENMLHDEFADPVFCTMVYAIVFLFGIAIGSFLNVVIIRLPRHESLIKRSSHCMTCGAKIRARDLIPYLAGSHSRENVTTAARKYPRATR